MNAEYGPVCGTAGLPLFSMFVVGKVVEEDRRLLLASELESITLLDGTPRSLGPTARDTCVVFEDICLLGNGGRLQLLQLKYLHKTVSLEPIKGVRRTTMNSSATCVSPPAPFILVVLTPPSCSRHPELLLFLQSHLSLLPLKTLFRTVRFPSYAPRASCRLSLT